MKQSNNRSHTLLSSVCLVFTIILISDFENELSEKTALASMQRLFENREKDNLADFVIESNDGTKFKVHSLILLSR